jgi:hypothetical protein
MSQTDKQYDAVVAACREVFLHKTADYGPSWRVYRTISVVDQLYIKARRIRTIQEKGVQRIGDDVASELKGIVNYAIMALIQLELQPADTADLLPADVEALYNAKVAHAKALMNDKNHDYGEAWREMSQESFVDLTLAKLLRIRQIIANEGKTLVSEGIDANYYDILNYAVFALILIQEGKH